jgi:tRNA(fMet)-specific endonuclease VapC
MALSHLLDTSVYSQPIRPRPLEVVQRRWEQLGDDRLCTSAICETELRDGLERRGSQKLWRAYTEILHARLTILPVDVRVAEAYGRLSARMQAKGLRRPAFDLLIAATAKAQGLIVATCNYKDFAPIEGIAVEDWSLPIQGRGAAE